MSKKYASHYEYLEDNLIEFFQAMGVDTNWNGKGLISAHGDKAYGYKDIWAEKGIPFNHGVACYLLTYCHPFSKEVRETNDGWVDPGRWVTINYEHRFKQSLP